MFSCGGGSTVVGVVGFTSSGRGAYSALLRFGFSENMLVTSLASCSFAEVPVP